MRKLELAASLLLAACAAAPRPAEPAQISPPVEPPPEPVRTSRLDPPIVGYNAALIRAEAERNVGDRLGQHALRLATSSATSIMVTHHQGLPRPVQNPDGSWGYEPPGANAVIRTPAGWTGWTGRTQRPVAAARAAEIDRILADPRFWAEPNYVAPTCTDAGARRMVVRHAGRTVVRQQSCGGTGLTGRLWELVFAGPG
jgi:hypothetical protein